MSCRALACLIFWASAMTVSAQIPGPTDTMILAAEREMQSGSAGPAIRQLVLSGDQALRQGNPALGLHRLETAARLAPDLAAAQASLGQAYVSLARHHSAIPVLRKALALGAPKGAIRFLLAGALWETGELEEADRLYAMLWQTRGPQSKVAAAALGSLRVWRGDAVGALAPLQSLQNERPQDTVVLFDLARALEDTGSLEEAERIYATIVEMVEEPPLGPLYRHARVLARLGRNAEAGVRLKAYREAYEADQVAAHQRTRSRAALDYGWTMIEGGDYRAAARHFRTLPAIAEAVAGQAQALMMAGDNTEARTILEKALLHWPEDGGLRQLHASLGVSLP